MDSPKRLHDDVLDDAEDAGAETPTTDAPVDAPAPASEGTPAVDAD